MVDSSTTSWPRWTTWPSARPAEIERPQVGLSVGRQRRGYADEDRIGAGERREVRPRLDLGQHRLQALGRDVLDVGRAGLDGRDLALVQVNGNDVLAGFGKGNG